MSPRRKSGLRPEHLAALKHLPDVLEALGALRAEDAKVRALMGGTGAAWPPPYTPEMSALVDRQMAEGEAAMRKQIATHHYGPPANPTLDTPERREFEAARRAGATIPDKAPDPFADPLRTASGAQRERMAEQRALIQAERAKRGLPPSSAMPAPPDEDVVVREESLPESVNGSTGAQEERGP